MRRKTNPDTASSHEVRERLLACPPVTLSARQGKIFVGSVKLWQRLHDEGLLWPTVASPAEGVAAIYSTDAVRAALAALHEANKPTQEVSNAN